MVTVCNLPLLCVRVRLCTWAWHAHAGAHCCGTGVEVRGQLVESVLHECSRDRTQVTRRWATCSDCLSLQTHMAMLPCRTAHSNVIQTSLFELTGNYNTKQKPLYRLQKEKGGRLNGSSSSFRNSLISDDTPTQRSLSQSYKDTRIAPANKLWPNPHLESSVKHFSFK